MKRRGFLARAAAAVAAFIGLPAALEAESPELAAAMIPEGGTEAVFIRPATLDEAIERLRVDLWNYHAIKLHGPTKGDIRGVVRFDLADTGSPPLCAAFGVSVRRPTALPRDTHEQMLIRQIRYQAAKAIESFRDARARV